MKMRAFARSSATAMIEPPNSTKRLRCDYIAARNPEIHPLIPMCHPIRHPQLPWEKQHRYGLMR
jgi:hypothetical protein